jgi:trk system potassium uptake protein TrkA
MKRSRHSALVIGLGRFGSAVARRLLSLGWDVVGVDNDPVVVEGLQHELEHIMLLDASDEEALASVGVPDFEVCIVARGGSIEGSVLFVLNLQHLEAKRVVAKAVSEYHSAHSAPTGRGKRSTIPELKPGTNLAESLQAPHLNTGSPTRKDRLAVVRVPKVAPVVRHNLWRETQRPSRALWRAFQQKDNCSTFDNFSLLDRVNQVVIRQRPDDVDRPGALTPDSYISHATCALRMRL